VFDDGGLLMGYGGFWALGYGIGRVASSRARRRMVGFTMGLFVWRYWKGWLLWRRHKSHEVSI
jgi:hypothetical protein